ncbi:MAG: alpha/beta fold hydrolase [Hyphomicrobiaceae bacterium]
MNFMTEHPPEYAMPEHVTSEHIILPDGRRLSYRRYGAVDGAPVIALHGTPGFGLKFGFAAKAAADKGMTLICPDRWGYGQTQAPARVARTLADFAIDLEALVDAVGCGRRVGLLAISGGGPFAVATAARLGDRVSSLGLVAPVGPIVCMPQTGERTIAAMTPFHHFCFRLLPRVPGAVEALFAVFGVVARKAPDLAMKIVTVRAASSDRKLMLDEAERRGQAQVFGGGLAAGALGPAIDMRIFSQRWDIAFGDVVAKTQIWQGSADRNVPVSAAERLAREISHADYTPIDNAGHCWIAQNADLVMDWFAKNDARC